MTTGPCSNAPPPVDRPTKLIRCYLHSAGGLLAVVAVAKLISAFGGAAILHRGDPILGFSYQWVLCLAAILEDTVAGICFSNQSQGFKSGTIAWLTGMVLLYRLGLAWIKYPGACKCLGNLTDALHIPPHWANTAALGILIYLLAGSVASLLWCRRRKRMAPATGQPTETPTVA